MAVINKNVVAVFGKGILARAVSAVDFDSQNIPSELYDGFRAVCGLARPVGTTQRRYPWSIVQPATPVQFDVWDKFLYCTRCFADQTQEQREWWYDQSIGSGLFYYTYFMKQTLTIVHLGVIPDWCPEIWAEYFPGTKLDLVRWKEPWSLQLPLPWYVNEAFIAGQTGGIPGGAYDVRCETYQNITPLAPYSIEYKLAIWLTGSNIYNDEVYLRLYPGELALGVKHGQAYFIVRSTPGPPSPLWFPVEQGVLYSVKVRFPEYNPGEPDTLMEAYLNGELMATIQYPAPWGRWINFYTHWHNATGQNTLVTKVDDIIVRKI